MEAWYSPDDPTYLQTMRSVAKSRLPQNLYKLLEDRIEIIDYLALASFGLPRGFINMLAFVLGVDEGAGTGKGTPPVQAEAAVAADAESVLGIFTSLKGKLPRYRRFVELGVVLENAIARRLPSSNGIRNPGKVKQPQLESRSHSRTRFRAYSEWPNMQG